jgi:peptide/nickel transport system permease protein
MMAEVAEAAGSAAEERYAIASQWQLTWWQFRRHRLALVSGVVIVLFYLVVMFADFFAYADPNAMAAERAYLPPQPIQWESSMGPVVHPLKGVRDMKTFKRVYKPDPTTSYPVRLFAEGYSYKLLGFFQTNRHLIGVAGARAEDSLFLLGTDDLGRDLWSRLVLGSRTSLLIGLTAVGLSLVLGIILGGISGLYGGVVDTVIQRVIEILRSIPTIPLWLGLVAAMPRDWSVEQVYLAITIILSLIGWTELARVVRGRFLSLRHEDFVMAAELAGCGQMRIIFKHLVPSFLSHIIASTTLAIPVMILSETSLSFLGLGMRPPAISWGVLLQSAQNLQVLANAPWLLVPAIPVIVIILAFNFLGDGLRDAADPHAT